MVPAEQQGNIAEAARRIAKVRRAFRPAAERGWASAWCRTYASAAAEPRRKSCGGALRGHIHASVHDRRIRP